MTRRFAISLCLPVMAAVYALARIGGDAHAAAQTAVCPAAHETWLLSTRRLPCVSGNLPKNGPAIAAQKLSSNPRRWENASLLEFLGAATRRSSGVDRRTRQSDDDARRRELRRVVRTLVAGWLCRPGSARSRLVVAQRTDSRCASTTFG
ncbi:MAG: hypothetical protein QM811_05155 [Pirellulales bacterium]